MKPSPRTHIKKYGLWFDKSVHNDVTIELYCWRTDEREENTGGRLTALDHFWNFCDVAWNNNPRSPGKVIRNEWSDRMAEGLIYHTYCALAGCGSSGKSHIMAAYGIGCYLASPLNTKVILTSTTLQAAQMRVWKSVSELWLDEFPGKMVQSKCLIRGYNKKGKLSEETGLKLLAASGTSTTEIDSAFIGIKQEILIALLDELSDIPMGVLNACYTNLEMNPRFELKAASNPNLYTDPFGIFCKPKDGWASITEKDMIWRTSRGVCLRFDSELSPNILADKILYTWLPKKESIQMAKDDFGERSRFFYRMHKAFWFADASDETIYSEGELMKYKANLPILEEEFAGKDPQEVYAAGGDPAYTQGGDRFPVVIGRVVQLDGRAVLEIMDVEIIKDDIDSVHANRSYHSVSEMEKICIKHGIDPENFGFDMTGAGIPFRDIVVAEWSSLPLGVNFGGAPSTLQISPVDKRISKDVYANRVTEIWVRMKGLLREGRIRGIPHDIIAEMCERRWHKNQVSKNKLRIESKIDMKSRGLKSPDLADSLFVLLETIIRRGLMGEMETIELDKRSARQWEETADAFNIEMNSDLFLDYE